MPEQMPERIWASEVCDADRNTMLGSWADEAEYDPLYTAYVRADLYEELRQGITELHELWHKTFPKRQAKCGSE